MSLEKSRFYYRVYGLEVESEININEFVSIEDINAEIIECLKEYL